MRRPSIALSIVLLAGCGSRVPQTCKPSPKQTSECMARHKGNDREMLLSCFPFTRPQRIAGAWITGFETNEFYEGAVASRSLINSQVGDTELEVEIPQAHLAIPSPKVFALDMLGRRSNCDMGYPHHIIVVDRVLGIREASGGR